jgi:hypothetical protein
MRDKHALDLGISWRMLSGCGFDGQFLQRPACHRAFIDIGDDKEAMSALVDAEPGSELSELYHAANSTR